MTLIELGFACLCLFFGVTAGYIGYGVAGSTGAIVGAGAGFGGFYLLILAFSLLNSVWQWLCPLRPNCRNGICQASDYKRVEICEGCLVYQCKCGMMYMLKGRQFLELLPDGTHKQFMRKRILGGWEHDGGRKGDEEEKGRKKR